MLHLKGHLNKQIKTSLIGGMDKGQKHLKFFLLIFSKNEAQAQEAQVQKGQTQPMRSKAKALGDEHHWMSLFVITLV